MVKKIKILVLAPNVPAEVREIDQSLEAMQAVVGRYVECPTSAFYGNGIDLWCNEEGKINGMEINHRKANPIPGDILCGTYFLSRHTPSGKTKSLTDKDIEKYTKLLG